MGIKSFFENDWRRIQEAGSVLVGTYRDYDSKHPKTSKVATATLILIKWWVLLALTVAILSAAYDTVVARPQREQAQRVAEEQRRVLTQTLEEERTRPRRECLQRLGLPDTGQLISGDDLRKCLDIFKR